MVPVEVQIRRWLSDPRYERYLRAAGGDSQRAVELYEWNAQLASAMFEAVHYAEVVIRNALDVALAAHFNEHRTRIPWFLGMSEVAQGSSTQIEEVRRRLIREHKAETRDQIIAGLSLGFWRNLLDKKYSQLWVDCLRLAFPLSSGDRKDVAAAFARIHPFRNRVAHHEPIFQKNVAAELDIVVALVGWVDADAAAWIEHTQRVRELLTQRPIPRLDTVVVAAGDAWQLYRDVIAYVCQPGRSFQDVDYVAFYSDRQIQPEVARIRWKLDGVPWTDAAVRHFRKPVGTESALGDATLDPGDIPESLRSRHLDADRLADIIEASRRSKWTQGRYQVFGLSKPGDPDHVTLPQAVPHQNRGRGSAFTQSQRYVLLERLRRARTTADLDSSTS